MLISHYFVIQLKHIDLFEVDGDCDHLLQRDFLNHFDLHKLQKVAQRNAHVEFFMSDQSDQVGANVNPDLRLHRVERVANDVLDHQVLLEPF